MTKPKPKINADALLARIELLPNAEGRRRCIFRCDVVDFIHDAVAIEELATEQPQGRVWEGWAIFDQQGEFVGATRDEEAQREMVKPGERLGVVHVTEPKLPSAADVYGILSRGDAPASDEEPQADPSQEGGKDQRGVFNKYRVERLDGKSAPGRKHDGCAYFVLDIDHDPHALPALLAYADSCEEEIPLLARDLRKAAEMRAFGLESRAVMELKDGVRRDPSQEGESGEAKWLCERCMGRNPFSVTYCETEQCEGQFPVDTPQEGESGGPFREFLVALRDDLLDPKNREELASLSGEEFADHVGSLISAKLKVREEMDAMRSREEVEAGQQDSWQEWRDYYSEDGDGPTGDENVAFDAGFSACIDLAYPDPPEGAEGGDPLDHELRIRVLESRADANANLREKVEHKADYNEARITALEERLAALEKGWSNHDESITRTLDLFKEHLLKNHAPPAKGAADDDHA